MEEPKPRRHEIWEIADALQMDLRAANAKLVELRARLSQLDIPIPERTVCPHCGPMPYGQRKLAEHMHTSHGEPLADEKAA